MNKKILTVSIILFLSILLVAGCSTKEPSITPTPLPTPTPPVAELPSSDIPPDRGTDFISAEEVKAKLEAGFNLVVVDCRSTREYKKSHIVGSLSVPEESMTGSYDYSSFDGYDEIVTYWAWEHETYSARAVQKLIEAGYLNAKAIIGGLAALREAGFPVEGTSHEN